MTRMFEVTWEGPFTFTDILTSPEIRQKYSCSGVYLWKEVNGECEQIAYIGKASGAPTLFQRHVQHYMGYIGGTYSLPAEFRTSHTSWALDTNDPVVMNTILNKEQFLLVVNDGYEYIKHLRIYFACLPAADIALVERELLYKLKPIRTTWGTLTPPGELVEVQHGGTLCLQTPH